jgi:hypothetical protein
MVIFISSKILVLSGNFVVIYWICSIARGKCLEEK